MTRPETVAWPTLERLEAAGFEKCGTRHCRTALDPANVDSPYCSSCRKNRRERKQRGRR